MRAREFLREDPQQPAAAKPLDPASKLNFITDKLSSGEVTDTKTIDFIYKILNKPDIKQSVQGILGKIEATDTDVARFQQLNNNVLNKIIRKFPVEKETLDHFLATWSSGKGFVNTALLKSGSKGTISDLIPDQTAQLAFDTFEQFRSVYKLPKKGSTGYGEFGLSMLSPFITLKAPGDIEVAGNPIEVKGNDARLYADERAGKVAAAESIELDEAKGDAPGALNNVVFGLLNKDKNISDVTVQEVTRAFQSRGRNDAAQIINSIKQQGPDQGFETLKIEWWKAGFNSYQQSIKMPIMVIGFGQFYISDKADDFIAWGCLPKSTTNYGYMFGRQAGQSRETYPKIYVPGHNK